MKTNFLFFGALLFCTLLSQAQLSLTKSGYEPVVGDVRNMAGYDSISALPKSTGMGQIWDFATLSPKSWTETTTYVSVASTPGASLFPSATIAGRRGTDNYEYFNSSASNWEFMGQFKSSNNEKLVLSNNAVFLVWPVSYGITNTDVAAGIETSGSNSSTLSATISFSAIGAGTVIMPGAIAHNNCLQVLTVLNLTTATGSGTTTSVETTYEYYSAAKKFPIVRLQYSSETTGSGTTKEYDLGLNSEGLVVGLENNKMNEAALFLYPNPGSEKVFIESDKAGEIYQIEIRDLSGKIVLTQAGCEFIDVSGLAPAVYIAGFHFENGIAYKPLVVNR